MVVRDKIDGLQQWVKHIFAEKQIETTSKRCAIHFTSSDIILVHIDKNQTNIECIFSEIIPYQETNMIPTLLTRLADKYHLRAIPTYWLLSLDDYQLFLIDSLPVEPTEFNDALNWRVKSLITYPLDEAIIDYFKLPPKKGSLTNNPMIGAVTAKMNTLKKISQSIKSSGFPITVIDIPEFALRNLSALYETNDKSMAFICFFKKEAILNITRQKKLYFTRRMTLPPLHERKDSDYEQISLDILRYFDYYQSQWRYPSPNHIFITSETNNVIEIAKILADHLLLTVQPFTLNPSMISGDIDNFNESKILLALGSALREDEHAKTEH